MAGGAFGGVVPREVVVAVGEVDVGFVEDGGPLEGGAVEALAGEAVAVFGGEGGVAGELVADFGAVAGSGPVYGVLGGGGAVQIVGGAVFPGVEVGVALIVVVVGVVCFLDGGWGLGFIVGGCHGGGGEWVFLILL